MASGTAPWWTGHVWSLARDREGCRRLQQAIDGAASEEECAALAGELRGHVAEALRCPQANFVLQHCVAKLHPRSVQFLVDELQRKGAASVAHAARHKYGCRIFQRLLERCPPAQLCVLSGHLLTDALVTCLHPFGNYTMQHLMEHGTAGQRRQLATLLEQHASAVAANPHGCAVLCKALTFAPGTQRARLAAAFLRTASVVDSTSRTRLNMLAAKLAQEALVALQ